MNYSSREPYGILQPDGSVKGTNDVMIAWGERNDDSRRIVKTFIGPQYVSTVFLVLNHGWGNRPEWFETMVFGGQLDQTIQRRWETIQEAKMGHSSVIEELRELNFRLGNECHELSSGEHVWIDSEGGIYLYKDGKLSRPV